MLERDLPSDRHRDVRDNMTLRDNLASLRHFPPDLLILSGLPFLGIALFTSWLFNLRGTEWIAA